MPTDSLGLESVISASDVRSLRESTSVVDVVATQQEDSCPAFVTHGRKR